MTEQMSARPSRRTAQRVVAEQAVFLSTAPVEPQDRKLAAWVVGISSIAFLALLPIAQRPLPHVWAFIPIYESAIAFSDLMTAAILLIQFNILQQRALLALACGYLFTALMTIAHALTFPGLFAPTGLLGAGPQSTAWLYVFWHAGFPIAVMAYVVLRGRDDGPERPSQPGNRTLLLGVGSVLAAVVGLTILATSGKALLPDVLTRGANGIGLIVTVSTDLALTFVALLTLWLRWRSHSVLDLWLTVVMCAWLFDVALSALLNAQRFDVGFYAGRSYGFLAATFVLLMLLQETGFLYAQLAELFEEERRGRRREAEERRRLFETSLDLILVTDRAGNFLRVSPSSLAILGHRPEEMIGRNGVDFVLPGDLAATRNEMRLARRGKQMRNFVTRYRHKDGQIVTLDWSGVWSEPEQRYFFIGRDVTEQKRVERMKDEFVATVSHELRTPLTSIMGSIGIIESGAAGKLSDTPGHLLKIAQANCRRLADIVNDILDFEKIEAGKMAFTCKPVDVLPLLSEVAQLNQAIATQQGVRLRLDSASVPGTIFADADRLGQVITNLVSNAIKFSPRGSEVTLCAENTGDLVRIKVRDHGPGIPDGYKERIFEKFVQVDATDRRERGGTGLGLSIAKQIVSQLGGQIGFDRAPGGGTVFKVELKAVHADYPAVIETARAALAS